MPTTVTQPRPAARAQRRGQSHARSVASPVSRAPVLMITEGTYPFAMGGVSSWCDALISGIPDSEWEIIAIVAGNRRLRPAFTLPANARLVRTIELWAEDPPLSPSMRRGRASRNPLPSRLLRGLLPWDADSRALTAALVSCREHPHAIRREFRSSAAWRDFLAVLQVLLSEPHEHTGPAPVYDALDAALLYQTLYWMAQTAAAPTPRCSLLHVTAAGWSAIPAIVHRQLTGTPMLLTEHGVYVREAYLAAARQLAGRPAAQHISTRLALGLTRAAYAAADVVAPVTEANAAWERSLGVPEQRIRVIPNGLRAPDRPQAPPRSGRVIALGRIDPLKDVQTMLLVADAVRRRVPEVRFEYWGPVAAGEEDYAAACVRMHARLQLGEHFTFMGATTEPQSVIRSADLVLMTSISEGMPMTLLEAMAQARPIVATGVGGVPGVVRGCGLVAPPGDVNGLASAIITLLRRPLLAEALGRRGHERLLRRYTLAGSVGAYRELIHELSDGGGDAQRSR